MGVPPQQTLVLTSEGRRDLEQRLDRTLEALAERAERMSAGDRGPDETAEHQHLISEVEALTAALATATDVGSVEEDPTIVELGDEVDVETDDGLETYAIVHPLEADVERGRISVVSPLGRALLGARPGEQVTVEAPAGSYPCTVRARRRLT
jgi:transcription elongation GreA/GreB family factor